MAREICKCVPLPPARRKPSRAIRCASKLLLRNGLFGCFLFILASYCCYLRSTVQIVKHYIPNDVDWPDVSSIAMPMSTESDRPSYASKSEQEARTHRFPSVEDRVKIYMGPWYTPPCEETDKVAYRFYNQTTDGEKHRFLLVHELPQIGNPDRRFFFASGSMVSARAFFLDRTTVMSCTSDDYCADTKDYILPTLDRLDANTQTSIPTIVQYVQKLFELICVLYSNFYSQCHCPISRFSFFGKVRGRGNNQRLHNNRLE
jgi:hypothetical protein